MCGKRVQSTIISMNGCLLKTGLKLECHRCLAKCAEYNYIYEKMFVGNCVYGKNFENKSACHCQCERLSARESTN